MAAKKVPAKKVPAKKEPTPAKKKTASAADFRKKEETDKKKMSRTDKSGNSGFGAGRKEGVLYPNPNYKKPKDASAGNFRKADQESTAKYKSGVGRTDAKGNKGFGGKTVYPKSQPEAFWNSPGGKVIRRTNPIMVLGDTLSSLENFMSKRTKKKGPGEW